MSYERLHNFNPGPAVLPEVVLETVRENLLNYQGSGLGVMELSHRAPHFEEIIATTEAAVRRLAGIGDEYAVLFTTGGATTQFSMLPMNLLSRGREGNYLLSGFWAQAALKEAKKFGAVHVAGSSEAAGFQSLPDRLALSDNPAYLHFTSNNTIYGTQFAAEPEAGGVPLVCDASSDIFCRPLASEKYALIYAGAQKNLGPAGVTLVIIRRDLLERIPEGLPLMLDYRTYVQSNSLYNTPPTFPIYVVGEVLKWIEAQGGLAALGRRNQEKADLLYRAIDESGFYRGFAAHEARSTMNVTFRLPTVELEDAFVKEAAKAGLVGLKGHRSVGGLRASLYNACPLEAVQALVAFMNEFHRVRG